jgi:hypothetical protein
MSTLTFYGVCMSFRVILIDLVMASGIFKVLRSSQGVHVGRRRRLSEDGERGMWH